MFNLLFLKDHLEEMICDFIDQDIYDRLNNSIYNVDKLKKLISQSTHEIKAMLENICSIVIIVVETEKKIIWKCAEIAVLHFCRTLFNNLYWQEEKGTFE